MERLTEKSFKGDCFEYDLVNFTHKVKEFNNYDTFFAYNMAVKELGKYEDFIEEQGFQSLKDLKEHFKNAIPKFKNKQFIYALFTNTDIIKGQIDSYDYYSKSYLIFFNDAVGSKWIVEDLCFKTKAEARQKLKKTQRCNYV